MKLLILLCFILVISCQSLKLEGDTRKGDKESDISIQLHDTF